MVNVAAQQLGEELMEKLAMDSLISAYDRLDAINSMVREGAIHELKERNKLYPEVVKLTTRHVRAFFGMPVEFVDMGPLTSR